MPSRGVHYFDLPSTCAQAGGREQIVDACEHFTHALLSDWQVVGVSACIAPAFAHPRSCVPAGSKVGAGGWYSGNPLLRHYDLTLYGFSTAVDTTVSQSRTPSFSIRFRVSCSAVSHRVNRHRATSLRYGFSGSVCAITTRQYAYPVTRRDPTNMKQQHQRSEALSIHRRRTFFRC